MERESNYFKTICGIFFEGVLLLQPTSESVKFITLFFNIYELINGFYASPDFRGTQGKTRDLGDQSNGPVTNGPRHWFKPLKAMEMMMTMMMNTTMVP